MKMSKRSLYSGVMAIMVTPRDESGRVSEERLSSHVSFLQRNGVTNGNGAIVATGSIGECAALTNEERKRVWKAAVQSANDKTPIIAGINHTDPDQVIEMSNSALEVGAAGVMIMTPYYWKPSKDSVRAFFEAVLPKIGLPVMLYNNIPATQMDLPLDILTELAQRENVAAIKECTPKFVKLERVVGKLSGKISVINGNGEFWEPYATLMGCSGFASGLVNFAPNRTIEIMQAARNGDYDRVFEIKRSLQPYFDFFFDKTEKYGMSVEPDILKTASSFVGSEVGPSKPPVTRLNNEDRRQLHDALKKSGVL